MGLGGVNAVHGSFVYRGRKGIDVAIFFIVTRLVAGKFGPLCLNFKFFENAALDHLAALGVNRMRDVSVEFRFRVGRRRRAGMHACAALVAKSGSKMIFRAALLTLRHDFAAGHRDKWAVVAS